MYEQIPQSDKKTKAYPNTSFFDLPPIVHHLWLAFVGRQRNFFKNQKILWAETQVAHQTRHHHWLAFVHQHRIFAKKPRKIRGPNDLAGLLMRGRRSES